MDFTEDKKTVRLHELNGTFPVAELEQVRVMLEERWGPMVESAKGGNYRYKSSFSFENHPAGGGLFFAEGVPECFVNLKGALLDELSGDDVFDLCWDLFNWYDEDGGSIFKVTHFDLAYDDWEKIISPRELLEKYAELGLCGPLRPSPFFGDPESGGLTVNFGKRGKWGSGSMLAVYDKAVESGGVIDAVRYEARWYSEKAVVAWEKLMSCTMTAEDWVFKGGQLVAGTIDFFETDEKNKTRRVLAPFWVRICEVLRGKLTVKVHKVRNDDLSDKRQWLIDSCSGIMWACYQDKLQAEGEQAAGQFIRDFWDQGERRCRPALRRLIRPVPGPPSKDGEQLGLAF